MHQIKLCSLDKKGLGESLLKKAKKKKKDKKRFVKTNLIFTWNTIRKKIFFWRQMLETWYLYNTEEFWDS